MRKLTNRSGFTLLEIIIVIIIVGVLASLALPRFFSTVEFSRSTEAFSSLTAMRGALERCYLNKNATYVACNTANFAALDINDPALAPNAHFDYSITAVSAAGYTIRATRKTNDGGDGASTIIVTQGTNTVSRVGTSSFLNI